MIHHREGRVDALAPVGGVTVHVRLGLVDRRDVQAWFGV
jgi:hypothetical protein